MLNVLVLSIHNDYTKLLKLTKQGKKMKLYHASPIENKESILNNGLCLMVTDKITLSDEQIQDEGVFGFDNIDSCHEFGEDCCGGEYAIFSFDVSSVKFVDEVC